MNTEGKIYHRKPLTPFSQNFITLLVNLQHTEIIQKYKIQCILIYLHFDRYIIIELLKAHTGFPQPSQTYLVEKISCHKIKKIFMSTKILFSWTSRISFSLNNIIQFRQRKYN